MSMEIEKDVSQKFDEHSKTKNNKFVPFKGGIPDSRHTSMNKTQSKVIFYDVKSHKSDQQMIHKLEAEINRLDAERDLLRHQNNKDSKCQTNSSSFRSTKSSKSYSQTLQQEVAKQSNATHLLKSPTIRDLYIDPTLTTMQYKRFFSHYLRNESRNIEFLNRARDSSLRKLARVMPPSDYQDPVGFAIYSRNSKMLRDILRHQIKPEELRSYKYVPSISSRDSRRSSLLSVHSESTTALSVSRKSSLVSSRITK